MKASLLNLGWSKRYCPLLLPLPVITLNTPFGMISFVNLASSKIDNDVSEEGLKTVQSPAAKTGAYFHAPIKKGKFHGTI